MRFFLKVLITSLAVVVGAHIMPGVLVADFVTAIVVAFVLGLLNAILKPILVFLTLPVTLFTLGLFLLFINAFIIQISAYFVRGFEVANFWYALLFGIVLSLISGLLEMPIKGRNGRKR